MVLYSEAKPIGVVPVVDREGVLDSIRVQRVVERLRVGSRAVLVADLDGDRPVAAQSRDVLVDERQRRVRVPLRQDIRPELALLVWQVEEERGLAGIGLEGGGDGQVTALNAFQLLEIFERLDRF